jgi:hypothetical protein
VHAPPQSGHDAFLSSVPLSETVTGWLKLDGWTLICTVTVPTQDGS